jgi:Fic family protein
MRHSIDRPPGVKPGPKGFSPYQQHHQYESLHPFTDGNGRSGRTIWAWHMMRVGRDPFALPFLHRFYYQALEAGR